MVILLTLLALLALAGAIYFSVKRQWRLAGLLGIAFVVLVVVRSAAVTYSASGGTGSGQQQGNFPLPLSTSVNAQPK